MPAQLPFGEVLGGRGALCVNPRNTETVPAKAAGAGFKWLALNVKDHAPEEWDTVRSRAKALGLTVYPWARLSTDTMQNKVCSVAKAWKTRPLLNIEDEAKPADVLGSKPWGQPAEVARRIRVYYPKIQPILSIPGWAYWGYTNWKPCADYPALLQILWEDMRIEKTRAAIAKVQADCETAARKEFKRVGVSYQTYRASSPTLYNLNRDAVSLIWADTTTDFKAWAKK